MKQPSFIQSLYYQQGVAQQPNDCTRQTPPRAKRRHAPNAPAVIVFRQLPNAGVCILTNIVGDFL